LEGDGYRVRTVTDGTAALGAVIDSPPDLVLIDSGLPGIDGGEVARQLRWTSGIAVIFVTAADSADDIHRGFRMGADDYIVKPFDPEELSLRVRAVLRRSGRVVTEVLESGDLVVDEGTHSVTMAGVMVPLTATEFKLLRVLMRNRTRVVPKSQLSGQVWGYDAGNHLLQVHMSSLRRKLEAHGPRMILTIRGTGYRLRPSEVAGVIANAS
jgi:two-component system OmpR family response regulator